MRKNDRKGRTGPKPKYAPEEVVEAMTEYLEEVVRLHRHTHRATLTGFAKYLGLSYPWFQKMHNSNGAYNDAISRVQYIYRAGGLYNLDRVVNFLGWQFRGEPEEFRAYAEYVTQPRPEVIRREWDYRPDIDEVVKLYFEKCEEMELSAV